MSFTHHIKQIAGSIYFENTITFVILIAGLIVGMQTFEDINLQCGTILRFIDDLVLVIFVIEILVLMIAEYPRIWRYFYEPWHIFDFTIVAICFLPIIFPESNTQFFAVFRLARILRLAKIFEKIKSLKILLVSLVRSLPSMSYIIVLLLLLFYIYGVIATDIFGKYAVDEFGTKTVTLSGGVASNTRLKELMGEKLELLGVKFYFPPPELCTDNAAMIAAAGYRRFLTEGPSKMDINDVPYLKLI